MNDTIHGDASIIPLGMKLSQMVSRNSSTNFTDVAKENFPLSHDNPLPSADKTFKLKNYTLKSQFSKTNEEPRSSDEPKQSYMPLLESMKQKSSLTYQHLCGSNRKRLTKKSTAYYQLHLLSSRKQSAEQGFDSFARLYGSANHEQSEDVTQEREKRSNDAFHFSPRMENVADFAPFRDDDIANAVDYGEPEPFVSEYFSSPSVQQHAEEGAKRSAARQVVETCYDRNVPSVDDLVHRECNASESAEQNVRFKNVPSPYLGDNYDINENNYDINEYSWRMDVDTRISIESFRDRLPYGEICSPEETRFYGSYPVSDEPSPRFSTTPETSNDNVNYECGVPVDATKSSRERIPKEKILFPFISFPENDGAIVIQEMLPTY